MEPSPALFRRHSFVSPTKKKERRKQTQSFVVLVAKVDTEILKITGKPKTIYRVVLSLTAPESSIPHPRHQNITTQNPPVPHAPRLLRPKGVGGWCPSEDALLSGSISTSSAVLIHQTPGDGGDIPAVCGAATAPVHLTARWETRRWAGAGEQVSLMGEAVSGRSVQRKEGETRRYEGVCGCSTSLNFSVVLFLYSVFVRVDVGSFLCSLSTAFLSISIGVAVGDVGKGALT